MSPENARIGLKLKSDSEQAVIYYWNDNANYWALLESSGNGEFDLEHSHRRVNLLFINLVLFKNTLLKTHVFWTSVTPYFLTFSTKLETEISYLTETLHNVRT